MRPIKAVSDGLLQLNKLLQAADDVKVGDRETRRYYLLQSEKLTTALQRALCHDDYRELYQWTPH